MNVVASINEASEHDDESDCTSSDTDDVSDGAEYVDYAQAFEDSVGNIYTLEEILHEELLVVPQGMTATLVNSRDQNRPSTFAVTSTNTTDTEHYTGTTTTPRSSIR